MADAPPPFEVLVGAREGRPVVTVSGDLDIATARELRAALPSVSAGAPAMLDLSGVTFIDSSGLGLLNELVSGGGWQLRSGEIHPRVRRALVVTGMLEVLGLDAPGEP